MASKPTVAVSMGDPGGIGAARGFDFETKKKPGGGKKKGKKK